MVARAGERRSGGPGRAATGEVEHPVLGGVDSLSEALAPVEVQLPVEVLEGTRAPGVGKRWHGLVGIARHAEAPHVDGPEDLEGAWCVLDEAARPVDVRAVGGGPRVAHALGHVRQLRPAVRGRVVHEGMTGRRAARLEPVEASERVELAADQRPVRLARPFRPGRQSAPPDGGEAAPAGAPVGLAGVGSARRTSVAGTGIGPRTGTAVGAPRSCVERGASVRSSAGSAVHRRSDPPDPAEPQARPTTSTATVHPRRNTVLPPARPRSVRGPPAPRE